MPLITIEEAVLVRNAALDGYVIRDGNDRIMLASRTNRADRTPWDLGVAAARSGLPHLHPTDLAPDQARHWSAGYDAATAARTWSAEQRGR